MNNSDVKIKREILLMCKDNLKWCESDV